MSFDRTPPSNLDAAQPTDWLDAVLVDAETPATSDDAAAFTAAVMRRVRRHGAAGERGQRRAPLAAQQALAQLQQRRVHESRRTRWGFGGTAAGVALALGTLTFVRGVDLAGAAALPGWAALPLVALLVTATLVYSLVGDSRA